MLKNSEKILSMLETCKKGRNNLIKRLTTYKNTFEYKRVLLEIMLEWMDKEYLLTNIFFLLLYF